MNIPTPILDLGQPGAHLPFEIHTMQWISANRSQQNEAAHRHNYHVVIWVIRATGYHQVDLENYQLQDNCVYCIAPGQVHQLVTEGPVEGFVISFAESFLGVADKQSDLLFRPAGSAPAVIPVSEEMKVPLAGVVSSLQREYENLFPLREEVLRDYLRIFLVYLSRQYEHAVAMPIVPRNAGLVRSFTDLLEQSFKLKHKVASYATELVVTPGYLNEIVKKVTGFPASHHIRQRIILEAKRQAIYADMSMKEIAYDLGFDDQAHFSKFFKKATGASFTEFRKNISNGFIQ